LVGPGGRDSGGTGGSNGADFGGITAGMAGDEPIAGSDGSAAAAGMDVDVAGGGSGAANTGGAAGGAGLGGATGGAGLGGAAGGASPYELIDDFEDQDTTLLFLSSLPVAQWRNGNWYSIQDATATGTKGPVWAIVLLSTVSDTRAGYALRFTASGFTDWGAGVGVDLRKTAGVKVAYDVSAYQGIRFYAKVATATQTALKVLVPTTFSDALGTKCSDTVPNKHCGDHFFCQVSSIKTTWAAYECSFTDLHQQLIAGALVQTSFDPATVYSLQFSLLTKTLPADLWLDDVSFILK
jgi:hypothetical protein